MELLRAEDRDLKAESLEQWGHDIMRHTFASNHLAYHEDLDKLTLQMGHTTTKTSFEHYLHEISKESAIEFWRIPGSSPETSKSAEVEPAVNGRQSARISNKI